MPHSLSQIYVHIVFHIKYNSPTIRYKDKHRLFSYIATVIKSNDSFPIIINGVENHIHILCSISKNIALAKLVEEIKRHSSRWIKGIDNYYHTFYWQVGYAAFSVSPSVKNNTIKYIKNQEQHHKSISFEKEYELFLKKYEIEYEKKYLWSD